MTSDLPKELTRNDPEWIRQFSRERAEMDRVSEVNYAVKKERIDMVKAMLGKGISIEIVSEIAHMSIEDVKKLVQG